MSKSHLLRYLLISPNLPVGGFCYSEGMESYLHNKNLKDSNEPEIIITNKEFQKPTNKINIQQKQNLKSDENNNKKKKVIKQNIINDKNKKIETNLELLYEKIYFIWFIVISFIIF